MEVHLMRVLHFLPAYAPAWHFGGPVLSVSRLCEGLVEQGVDVRVVTTNAGLPDFPRDQLAVPQNVNGVQVIYYPVDQLQGAIRSRALVDSIQHHTNWADLLHLSSIWQPLGIPVQEAAHASGVPVIQTLRGALGPYSWRRGWWKKVPYFLLKERPLLQRVAALHCTTIQEAREIRWLGLNPEIRVLPNPLELSQLRCDVELGRNWRLSKGIPLDQTLFLVAGRLHHKKGLDLLPSILSSIRNKFWHILFVGPDADGTGGKLRNELTRLGLAQRCHWLDPMPAAELQGPYNAADCLLLPSRHENFGNVVIEALACGCGVLISDRVGVSETVINCPGTRVSPRTLSSWQHQIQYVLTTKRPGHLSENWVKKNFSKKLIANNSLQLYRSLLN